MLTHIRIDNFRLVRSLQLDFHPGLSVITGETGAGKSIWVDAIGLALGNRVDGDAIRQQQNRCDITLCFDLRKIPAARQWLDEHDFASDEECIIHRTLHSNGTSRSTVNGRPCPLSLIREFAQHILNIHSQHQHQALLQRDAQRECLDQFAQCTALTQQLREIVSKWKSVYRDLERINQQAAARDSELEFLRFQQEEIEALHLQTNEWQELSTKHQQHHNAKSLLVALSQAIELTTEGEEFSAGLFLQQALDHLNHLHHTEPQIESIKTLLQTALIHLQEAGDELLRCRDRFDLDADELPQIEKRLGLIHDLARKHHVTPQELPAIAQSLAQKIHSLEHLEVEQKTLSQALATLQKQYDQFAASLTYQRQQAAQQLSAQITERMQLLGMQGGQFCVQLQAINEPVSTHGRERIEFLVSTNPGQPLQAMSKVVSGGELSRISLALQVVSAQQEGTPTLIFDEVDTGIGGKTAETVGQLLRQLGDSAQVLCITHLPQVAALGQHHFQVSKQSQEQDTFTSVKALDKSERIDELARMLGGITITRQTRAHAQEMIEALD